MIGLRNNHNAVSVHILTIVDAPQPIVNQSPDGLIVVVDGKISASHPILQDAIQNNGYVNLRGVQVSGYATAFGTATTSVALDGVYKNNNRVSAAKQSWSLPVSDTPAAFGDPVEKWVSVGQYGAKPDSNTDATAGIRQAFASGASTVYFPHGTYLISANITVPPTVRRIVGMMSAIHVVDGNAYTLNRDQGMFRVMNSKYPLSIEHMTFDNSDFGDQVGVEAASSEPVTLRDVAGAGVITLKRPATSGKVFIEDTCCGSMNIAGRNPVWMRQLDSEGLQPRVTNNGAPLWILGLKTEGNCTAVENTNGAQTEVLGGLMYIVRPVKQSVPAFVNTNSQMLVSFVEEGFTANALYTTYLADTESGTVHDFEAASQPPRNVAHMAPLLTTTK
jgi:hypothetical protein